MASTPAHAFLRTLIWIGSLAAGAGSSPPQSSRFAVQPLAVSSGNDAPVASTVAALGVEDADAGEIALLLTVQGTLWEICGAGDFDRDRNTDTL